MPEGCGLRCLRKSKSYQNLFVNVKQCQTELTAGEPALTDALKNKTQLQLIRNRWPPRKHLSNSMDEELEPNLNPTFTELEPNTHSLTHCCAWPARAVATFTTSDPAPMTTVSRLCTGDPLPPVVSRSSLAGQVDASSRGQGTNKKLIFKSYQDPNRTEPL